MEKQQSRWARKHGAIMEAATTVFLAKGYVGTSMDEVATVAAVSKQTVYRHFADKDRLFAEIVLATTDQVDNLVALVADTLGGSGAEVEENLRELARQFLSSLMQPRLIRLRRLVIANADRFPELGRAWYERGFERVLTTLATTFQRLAADGHLRLDDPNAAAEHFVGLLLWIPMNRVMFAGEERRGTDAELDHHADATIHAFLSIYRPTPAGTGDTTAPRTPPAAGVPRQSSMPATDPQPPRSPTMR